MKIGKITYNNTKGFTLVEMLLVAVIVSSIILMLFNYTQQRILQTKIDRTSAQMQQILNAGLAYYVMNGSWPVSKGNSSDLSPLSQFLPSYSTIVSPWDGSTYTIATDNNGYIFYVYINISATNATALWASSMVAGYLPTAYTTAAGGTPPTAGTACAVGGGCYVVSGVNIPGQNLNQAGAVNFAGLYKQGACVPVPECPVDSKGNTMKAQILVTPASASGLNDPGSNQVYPISSFTAYATGGTNTAPAKCNSSSTAAGTPSCIAVANNQGTLATKYWRVCLDVVTEKDNIVPSNTSISSAATDFGNNIALMAITRCAITNEPAGSKFTIYGN